MGRWPSVSANTVYIVRKKQILFIIFFLFSLWRGRGESMVHNTLMQLLCNYSPNLVTVMIFKFPENLMTLIVPQDQDQEDDECSPTLRCEGRKAPVADFSLCWYLSVPYDVWSGLVPSIFLCKCIVKTVGTMNHVNVLRDNRAAITMQKCD